MYVCELRWGRVNICGLSMSCESTDAGVAMDEMGSRTGGSSIGGSRERESGREIER